jgi:hypothetical protein
LGGYAKKVMGKNALIAALTPNVRLSANDFCDIAVFSKRICF